MCPVLDAITRNAAPALTTASTPKPYNDLLGLYGGMTGEATNVCRRTDAKVLADPLEIDGLLGQHPRVGVAVDAREVEQRVGRHQLPLPDKARVLLADTLVVVDP